MHCMMVSKISKHLMLLFNDTIRERTEKMVSFQNISCYCLTQSVKRKGCDIKISKHLMLLFNASATYLFAQLLMHFKTSHVIV